MTVRLGEYETTRILLFKKVMRSEDVHDLARKPTFFGYLRHLDNKKILTKKDIFLNAVRCFVRNTTLKKIESSCFLFWLKVELVNRDQSAPDWVELTCRLQETPAAQDGAAGAIEGWILRGFTCDCFFLIGWIMPDSLTIEKSWADMVLKWWSGDIYIYIFYIYDIFWI